jgi:zinc transporter, ZIP family
VAVSFSETVLLGALAGFTIYLSLPFGRLDLLSPRARVALAMFAVGVLAFLFVDVFEHALGMTEHAVEAYDEGEGTLGKAIGFPAMLVAGFAVGCAGLAMLERRMRRSKDLPPMAGGSSDAMTVEQAQALTSSVDVGRSRALRLGMTIAAAIGIHNFAEGLAIGVSASSGEIGLATVLIIGFALHNATEGFGIVGPLGDVRPTWAWLGLAGLVGGAPVFLGAMVGYNVTSEPLELAFYGVAGGAILYVIGEVWNAMRRYGHKELGLWLLCAGFTAGLVTDMFVAYAGG